MFVDRSKLFKNVDPWLKKDAHILRPLRFADTRSNLLTFPFFFFFFFFPRELQILSSTRVRLWFEFLFRGGRNKRKQGSENKKKQSVTNFARNIGETIRRMANMVTGKNGRDFWKQITRRWRQRTSRVTRQYRKRRNDIDVASAPARGPPTSLSCVVPTTRTIVNNDTLTACDNVIRTVPQ